MPSTQRLTTWMIRQQVHYCFGEHLCLLILWFPSNPEDLWIYKGSELWRSHTLELVPQPPQIPNAANIWVLGRGMYRLWRSPATWCLGGGLGIGALLIIGRNVFVAGISQTVEICDIKMSYSVSGKKSREVFFVGVMYAFIMLQSSIVLTYVQTTYIQKII